VVNPKGTLVKKFGKQLNLYCEPLATSRHSLTGKRFFGIARYTVPEDAAGRAMTDAKLPLHLITFKEILGGQSRTLPGNYWLSSILPENFILLNTKTAAKMGFKDGEVARLVSQSNTDGKWHLPNREAKDMVGKVKAIEGMAPDVVAISWSFGHWGYGASDAIVDGKVIKGEARRATGICPNAAMTVDAAMKNSCMSDPIGGSASFYDTRVNLIKA